MLPAGADPDRCAQLIARILKRFSRAAGAPAQQHLRRNVGQAMAVGRVLGRASLDPDPGGDDWIAGLRLGQHRDSGSQRLSLER